MTFSLNNSCIYEQLIKASHEEILKSGLPSLLNERKYEQIVLLYSYIHDVDLILSMKQAWGSYIYEKGMYYLNGLENTREAVMRVVGQIVDLKILTDTVLDECF